MLQFRFLVIFLFLYSGRISAQTTTVMERFSILSTAIEEQVIDELLINIAPNEIWLLTNLRVQNGQLIGTWATATERQQAAVLRLFNGQNVYLSAKRAQSMPVLLTLQDAAFLEGKEVVVSLENILHIHEFEKKSNNNNLIGFGAVFVASFIYLTLSN